MNNLRFRPSFLSIALLAFAFTRPASAQLARTYVFSAGNDANPCSRTAPCLTFQRAHDVTAAGGEINCLDTNDYGVLTITKSITIDCGSFGYITAPFAQGAILIAAGANGVVTIRNLSISGPSTQGGIFASSAIKALHVENVRISLPSTVCISLNVNAASLLTVDNATLSDCFEGIFALASSGTVVVNINNSRITNNSLAGVVAEDGSRVAIRDSAIYFNTLGVQQTNNFGSNLGSTVTVINSTLGYSSTAALQSRSGAFTLAFGNSFVNDVAAFNPAGGTIFTGSDNNNSGSAAGTANGGSVPKI